MERPLLSTRAIEERARGAVAGQAHLVFTGDAQRPDLSAAKLVAVDGMSLTVMDRFPDGFTVSFIPYTMAHTIANSYHVGSAVNLEADILAKEGDKICILELQGSLFFGTADQLFSELEADLKTRRFLILDLRRVRSVDLTAVHLLEQIEAQLSERGARLDGRLFRAERRLVGQGHLGAVLGRGHHVAAELREGQRPPAGGEPLGIEGGMIGAKMAVQMVRMVAKSRS